MTFPTPGRNPFPRGPHTQTWAVPNKDVPDVIQPPSFNTDIVTDEFIHSFSIYFAKSVTFTCSQRYTIQRTQSIVGQSFNFDRPLRALGTGCLIDDAPDTASFSQWNPSSDLELEAFEYLFITTEFILKRMIRKMNVRETEILQAIGLIEKAVVTSPESALFRLSRANASMALVVSVMIANKVNCDKPFTNAAWSQLYNIPTRDILTSEIFFLKSTGFSVTLAEHEFEKLALLKRKLIREFRTVKPPSQTPINPGHLSPTVPMNPSPDVKQPSFPGCYPSKQATSAPSQKNPPTDRSLRITIPSPSSSPPAAGPPNTFPSPHSPGTLSSRSINSLSSYCSSTTTSLSSSTVISSSSSAAAHITPTHPTALTQFPFSAPPSPHTTVRSTASLHSPMIPSPRIASTVVSPRHETTPRTLSSPNTLLSITPPTSPNHSPTPPIRPRATSARSTPSSQPPAPSSGFRLPMPPAAPHPPPRPAMTTRTVFRPRSSAPQQSKPSSGQATHPLPSSTQSKAAPQTLPTTTSKCQQTLLPQSTSSLTSSKSISQQKSTPLPHFHAPASSSKLPASTLTAINPPPLPRYVTSRPQHVPIGRLFAIAASSNATPRTQPAASRTDLQTPPPTTSLPTPSPPTLPPAPTSPPCPLSSPFSSRPHSLSSTMPLMKSKSFAIRLHQPVQQTMACIPPPTGDLTQPPPSSSSLPTSSSSTSVLPPLSRTTHHTFTPPRHPPTTISLTVSSSPSSPPPSQNLLQTPRAAQSTTPPTQHPQKPLPPATRNSSHRPIPTRSSTSSRHPSALPLPH